MIRFGNPSSSDKRRQRCWSWYWVELLLLWAVAETRADIHYATVYWLEAEKSFQIQDVLDRNGDAYGYYNDTIQSTGWGILEIKAGYGNQHISNEILMYAAGFLEGYLTASHMSDHFANLFPLMIKNVIIEQKVKDFIQKQDEWTRQQIKNNMDDPFWRNAGYVIAQLDGLYMGNVEWAKRQKRTPLNDFEINFLNSLGDLLDLITAFESQLRKSDFLSMPDVSRIYQWDMGHCSALIKVLPGYENIYFAHSSWFTYAATLRIYKHWDFKITDPQTKTGRASFSSYPADIQQAVLQSTQTIQKEIQRMQQEILEMKEEIVDQNIRMRGDISVALEGLATHVERVDCRIDSVVEHTQCLGNKVVVLEGEMEQQSVKLERIEDQVIIAQYKEMEFALRVRGLKENPKENLEVEMAQAMAPILMCDPGELIEQIDKIFRVNSWIARQKNLPRDVVIYFTKRATRNAIIQAFYKERFQVAGQNVIIL